MDQIPPNVLVSNCVTHTLDFLAITEQELHEIVIPLSLQVAVPCTGERAGGMRGAGAGGGPPDPRGSRPAGAAASLARGHVAALLRLVGAGMAPPAGAPACAAAPPPLPAVHGVASWFDVLFDGSQTQRWLSTAPGLPITHWCAAGEVAAGWAARGQVQAAGPASCLACLPSHCLWPAPSCLARILPLHRVTRIPPHATPPHAPSPAAAARRRFQLRCLLEQPVIVAQPGATVSGELRLVAHNRQSYDVHVALRAPPLTPGGPPQVGRRRRRRRSACLASAGAALLGQGRTAGMVGWAVGIGRSSGGGGCPGLPPRALEPDPCRLPASPPAGLSACLSALPCLQESRGKFDLKEPYYRQQMQWMMQMAAPADGGGAAAAAAQQQVQPAVVQGAPVQQPLREGG